MKNKKSIALLVFIALFATGFGFTVGTDDANAATRVCSSAQVSMIKSQERVVTSSQKTVDSDYKSNQTAQKRLNDANNKVSELEKREAESKKRLKSLAVGAVKNPKKAIQYKNAIVAEKRNLDSIQSKLAQARRQADIVETSADRSHRKLTNSTKELGRQTSNLASKRKMCRA
jgi:hypothetical protein